MIKVNFICHGNICRSPMAEFLFKDMVKKAGLAKDFLIVSTATSRDELGNPVHYGTKRKLAQYNISVSGKYSIQLTKSDYDKYDYLIGMDSYNIRNILRIVGADPHKKVYKLLDFAGGGDVDDPWYTGNFDKTYEDILRGLTAFLEKIKASL